MSMFGYKKGASDCRPLILPDLVSAAVGRFLYLPFLSFIYLWLPAAAALSASWMPSEYEIPKGAAVLNTSIRAKAVAAMSVFFVETLLVGYMP